MIRLATAEDVEAIREIYRPSIEKSAISFETNVPLPSEMQQRIKTCLQTYPWIVDEEQNHLRGYAYAGRFHERAAYRWAAQVSVYVEKNSMRQGVARRLYRVLLAMLERQGIRKVLAAITVPNEASQQFHEALGFEAVGVVSDVGFKLGRWQSMGWWQRTLGEGALHEPTEFLLLPQLADEFAGDLTPLAIDV